MKLIGRILFGFLVAYIGLNVYALSTFDMQTNYIKKYGNEAVADNDQVFFKSLYDYYIEDNILESTVVPSGESELGYNFYMFQGVAGGQNFLRIQMDQIEGYDISKGLEVVYTLEGGIEKTLTLYKISDEFQFGALDLSKLSDPDAEEANYLDIIDFKINALGAEEAKVEMYNFDGTLVLSKDDMQLAEALNTPIDPEAAEPVYPTPESLSLVKGITHSYFGEFQWILWRNMAMFVVIAGVIIYLLFFRKKQNHITPQVTKPVFKENLNSKVITHDNVKEEK